jgi:hypothetical protein
MGLGAAVAIYATAAPEPPNPLGYDMLDSKKDLRQLEMIGGKANVFAVTFLEWFKGLWHGRSLAFTVAALSLFLSLIFWLFTAFPITEDDDA